GGVVQIVMPQNWLFLTSYRKQRESLLKRTQFNLIGLLGAKGFQTPMWDFNVQLLTQTRFPAPDGFLVHGVDVAEPASAHEKAIGLIDTELLCRGQSAQLSSPDAMISFATVDTTKLFGTVVDCYQGTSTGDNLRYVRQF